MNYSIDDTLTIHSGTLVRHVKDELWVRAIPKSTPYNRATIYKPVQLVIPFPDYNIVYKNYNLER